MTDDRRIEVAPGVALHTLLWHPGAAGAGRAPILMVHGLASNARLWDGVARRLAALGHPVAAVDQRGHGQSDRPDDGYDFATLTDDLLAALEALGWREGAVVAGQSWGANVVLELAARHPTSLAALALVDGGTIELTGRFADWPTCEAALSPPALEGRTAASFERLLRLEHPDWPEEGIAGTLANVEVLPDGTIRPWLSRSRHLTILRHLWDHHPPDVYEAVKVPTLVLAADDPEMRGARWMSAKRAEIERAAAGLPDANIEWMTGDHDLHAQHPDAVAASLHALAASVA